MISNKKITVGTDCSGIEAPLIALDLLGQEYDHLFSSEIDRNCIKFIKRNFPPKVIYNDLKSRDIDEVPSVDLYIAGFPCQTFSTLGLREGFDNETKGTIFFYILEYIQKKLPSVFILENVKGLLIHDKGRTFRTIIASLESIQGYNISYKVVNTADYGLPQSRNRVYIVGSRDGIFKFPDPKHQSLRLEEILHNLPIEDPMGRHAERLQEVIQKYPECDFLNDMWILNLNVSSIEWFSRGRKDICPCLNTYSKFYIPKLHRYLSPYEALALQGIPWKNYDFNGFSNTALYKMAGNTMSVNVLTSILSALLFHNAIH